MGERRLAEKVVVKAVATACRETIDTMVEPADEAMRVRTPGGVFSVRWDERGSATALGQLAFFAEYPETSGRFEAWLESCPLSYTRPHAPALELAALYHERWEVEAVFDELKTRLVPRRRTLRRYVSPIC